LHLVALSSRSDIPFEATNNVQHLFQQLAVLPLWRCPGRLVDRDLPKLSVEVRPPLVKGFVICSAGKWSELLPLIE
jgi:hypothetical protein